MTVGANSYGTTAGVAALTPRTSGSAGDYLTTTRPTLAQVEAFIDQVSAMLNVLLSESGFAIPITQADCVLMLVMFVEQEVASIVEGVNGSGRFGPTGKSVNQSRYELINGDVQAFVSANATGFERLGATRTYSLTAGLDYRNVDESGNATAPIFQRSGFGNTFTDWDS